MNISDKAVEAAARELYARDVDRNTGGVVSQGQARDEWDRFPTDSGPYLEHRNHFRKQARIALEASAPFIAAEAWDEGARIATDRALLSGAGAKVDELRNPYKEEK